MVVRGSKLEDEDFVDTLDHLNDVHTILHLHVTCHKELEVGLQEDLDMPADMYAGRCTGKRKCMCAYSSQLHRHEWKHKRIDV